MALTAPAASSASASEILSGRLSLVAWLWAAVAGTAGLTFAGRTASAAAPLTRGAIFWCHSNSKSTCLVHLPMTREPTITGRRVALKNARQGCRIKIVARGARRSMGKHGLKSKREEKVLRAECWVLSGVGSTQHAAPSF